MPRKALIVLLISALVTLSSCKNDGREPEGYRVTSYDGNTHEWTIIRTGTFSGKFERKRLIVICNFFQWGSHPAAVGPDQCHLGVGQLIVPNPFPPKDKPQELVDVFEMPSEVLSITQGQGDNRTMQQFQILKYDLLPDNQE